MLDKEALAGTKLQKQWKEGQGGFRAAKFIFVLTGFENMGFIANMGSMVLYLSGVMHYDIPTSANTITNFLGSTFLLSIIGGFVSDTYLSRLSTSLIFGVVEVLALMMMTIQAYDSKLHPFKCNIPYTCTEGTKGGQALMLYISLCLLALGAGGVRGSLPALGGDQFDPNDPKEKKSLARFFNWLVLSTTVGATFGVTFIVYISTEISWGIGFLICMLATFIGFVVVIIGKSSYRVRLPGDSPILQIIQVIVVAVRNRSLSLPEDPDELHELDDNMILPNEKVPHTHQFRFLDKAAIVGKETSPEPWKVCTVTQVEEVKILTRMLPIIGSTILMNTCLAQLQTFSVQQGNTMNLYLGALKVPAPSIPVIPLVFMSALILVYEFFFVPFARKITNHPSGITQLQRVGVGLVLSAISMAIAGFVEVKRRNQSIHHPTDPISLFWLSFQYGVFGIADMFTLVGLLEFFYKEAPSGMKSLSTSFTFLSMSMGYFLSSIFVEIINLITGKFGEGGKGWLQGGHLNDIHLDRFYWFLGILSCLNFANYLFWASWYKYKPDDSNPDLKGDTSIGSSIIKAESLQVSEVRQDNTPSPDHTEKNIAEAAVHKEETIDIAQENKKSVSSPDRKPITEDKEEGKMFFELSQI